MYIFSSNIHIAETNKVETIFETKWYDQSNHAVSPVLFGYNNEITTEALLGIN